MATNTKKKKVVKKVTKTNVAKKANTNVTLTLGQATKLQAALSKAGKNYKFLDQKVQALNTPAV